MCGSVRVVGSMTTCRGLAQRGWTDSRAPRLFTRDPRVLPAPRPTLHSGSPRGAQREVSSRPCPGWPPAGPPAPVWVLGARAEPAPTLSAAVPSEPRWRLQLAPGSPKSAAWHQVWELSQSRNQTDACVHSQALGLSLHHHPPPHSGLGDAPPWLQFPHLLRGAGEPQGLTQQALLCSWTTGWGQGDSSDSWEDTSQLTGMGGPA